MRAFSISEMNPLSRQREVRSAGGRCSNSRFESRAETGYPCLSSDGFDGLGNFAMRSPSVPSFPNVLPTPQLWFFAHMYCSVCEVTKTPYSSSGRTFHLFRGPAASVRWSVRAKYAGTVPNASNRMPDPVGRPRAPSELLPTPAGVEDLGLATGTKIRL